jgi:hypothetical protein
MKTAKYVALLGALLLGLTSPGVRAADFGGHSYDVVLAQNLTWSAALTQAASMGGYLAIITSADEDNFIQSLVGTGEFWVGGKQSALQNTPDVGWKWLDGAAIPGVNGTSPYANWLPGEPNDYYDTVPALENSELYLAVRKLAGQTTPGAQTFTYGWNDEGNTGNITGFVVERDGRDVPEASTLLGGAVALVFGWAARRRANR